MLFKLCYIYFEIVEVDYRVKFVGNFLESKINRGGIKERIYKYIVYWVEMFCLDGMIEEYYFVLEYVIVLMFLY